MAIMLCPVNLKGGWKNWVCEGRKLLDEIIELRSLEGCGLAARFSTFERSLLSSHRGLAPEKGGKVA